MLNIIRDPEMISLRRHSNDNNCMFTQKFELVLELG